MWNKLLIVTQQCLTALRCPQLVVFEIPEIGEVIDQNGSGGALDSTNSG